MANGGWLGMKFASEGVNTFCKDFCLIIQGLVFFHGDVLLIQNLRVAEILQSTDRLFLQMHAPHAKSLDFQNEKA